MGLYLPVDLLHHCIGIYWLFICYALLFASFFVNWLRLDHLFLFFLWVLLVRFFFAAFVFLELFFRLDSLILIFYELFLNLTLLFIRLLFIFVILENLILFIGLFIIAYHFFLIFLILLLIRFEFINKMLNLYWYFFIPINFLDSWLKILVKTVTNTDLILYFLDQII